MALTPEQIAEFKALGYVLVPNLIDPPVLDNWHTQIRAKFGDLSDPAQQNAAGPRQQHREDITILRGFRFSPEETQLVNQPKVKAIVDHMGGDGQFCGEDGNLRLLWPEPECKWSLPERGHIDGYLGRRRTMPLFSSDWRPISTTWNHAAVAPSSGRAAISNHGNFFANTPITSTTALENTPNISTWSKIFNPLNCMQKRATSSSGTATSCTKPLKTPATTSAMACSPACRTKTRRHSETKYPMTSGNAGGYR